MQFNLMTMFGITGGIAICLFVAVKSHPLFAAPMLVLVAWTFLSARDPKLADRLELILLPIGLAILLLLVTFSTFIRW